ncbi:hypothetical protein RJ641_020180 [Dillenia turbinata]|uniref:Uncharacterized protein n=1 Tax=Dillenia turbinata TaxID=194707 RepID=A0AAN8YZC0_9MAGN
MDGQANSNNQKRDGKVELDVTREQYENLQKHEEEQEAKSKADVKLLDERACAELAKESIVQKNEKLLQELDVAQEQDENLQKHQEEQRAKSKKLLQNENLRKELVNTGNEKLLHECEILRNRLQECSVNFLIEEEDKLTMDTSSASDALDLLTTSDNRIGLLLAESIWI